MEQTLDTTRSVQRAAPAVWRWTLALAALFLFRLLFGLCFEFFFEDETQIFLIGLRAYAYRTWPWFGPDIVWTHSQIPGALQGLLVALPLYVAPFPEAPFVLLNAISFGALALLAWYIVRRLPALPRWLVWGWVMTCPWTINFSTSLINTSYILPGAVLFFAGFFESYPRLAIGAIPRRLALAMMGFGVTWVMQVHMSWPLLGPYLAAVFIARRRDGWRTLAGDAAVVAAGAAIPAVLLVPTFVRYGLHAGTGGTARNVTMHWVGFEAMISTVARFLSFASLEVAQFIGTDTAKRVMFALEHLWIVPLLAIVWVAGLAQPVWMAWTWFARRHPARAEWPAVKTLVLATVLLIAAAYCFASVPPQAHAFYAVAPIAFVYAAYCFAGIDSPRWRRVAAALLAVNIAFQLGVAFILGPTRSLYLHRDVVAAAVSRRDPDLLAHRRAFAMDARPEDADPRRDPRDELTLAEPEWSLHPVRAVVWHVTVRNDSTTRAYRDLLYQAVYRDASGNVLDTRHGLVRDVFEPGKPRRVEINDGSVRVPFASATIEVILAEALKPLR